jgi:glutaredoxin
MKKVPKLLPFVALVVAAIACGKRETPATKAFKPAALVHTQAGEKRAIVYGADWCEACHLAGAWLTSHGYTVIDRDIEKERDGAEAMQDALDAAGLTSPGIPVIELEGAVVLGFDQKKLEKITAK